MLYEQKPAGLNFFWSFSRCSRWLWLTEDEETTVTSGPVEAVRSGGVMEHLIYGTGSFPGCCCGLLHPHCSQQPADISDPAKMHKHNRKAVILTAQCHLISVLEVTK